MITASGAAERLRAACRGAQDLPAWERWTWIVLIGTFAVQRLIDALTVPMHCDELRTYFSFVTRGPLVALAVYPDPNNHVLFSFLSSLTHGLPLPEPLGLRLPSVVASCVLVSVVALALRSGGRAGAALAGTATLMALPPVAYYASSARGYMLCLLAAALGAVAAVRLAEAPRERSWRAVFVVAGAFGVVAVPTHVYCVACLTAVRAGFAVARRRPRELGIAVLDGALAGALAIVGYAGVLIHSGPHAITSNRYVISRSLAEVLTRLPDYVSGVGGWLLGDESSRFLVPALILISAVLLATAPRASTRYRAWAAIALAFALAVPVFPVVQRMLPFERNWIFVSLVPAICVRLALERLVSGETGQRVLAIASVVAGVGLGIAGSRLSHAANDTDAQLQRVVAWLQDQEVHDVYVSSRLAGLSVSYHARGGSVRPIVAHKWNPNDPHEAFADLDLESPPRAIVSRRSVAPPPRLGYQSAFEAGEFAIWLSPR